MTNSWPPSWPLHPTLSILGETGPMTDTEVLGALAATHDAIRVLRDLETNLAGDLGKRIGKGKGDLPDGRQYELARTTDRKEWDHDEWKRDARREIVNKVMGDHELTTTVNVVHPSGEVEELALGRLLQEAMAAIQNVQGSSPPKSTALKPLGLYASDYCTSTPGGWRFSAIEPKPTTTEGTEDA